MQAQTHEGPPARCVQARGRPSHGPLQGTAHTACPYLEPRPSRTHTCRELPPQRTRPRPAPVSDQVHTAHPVSPAGRCVAATPLGPAPTSPLPRRAPEAGSTQLLPTTMRSTLMGVSRDNGSPYLATPDEQQQQQQCRTRRRRTAVRGVGETLPAVRHCLGIG